MKFKPGYASHEIRYAKVVDVFGDYTLLIVWRMSSETMEWAVRSMDCIDLFPSRKRVSENFSCFAR